MPRRRARPTAFYKGFLDGEFLLAKMELRGESRRVLSALRSAMDWENWVRLPLRELAERTGIPWRQFTRGVGQLRERNVLFYGEHQDYGRCIRVALWVGWRGRDARHARALERAAADELPQLTLFLDVAAEG